jgi:hypothetical protein
MTGMNAETMRTLLVIFFVTIFLLAVSYLRRRKMSCWAYAFWGAFALLLPAFGPFFVIAYCPGERRKDIWGFKGRKASKRFWNSELM